MLLEKLYQKKLIQFPKWLISNTHYLTLMGSKVYGCSEDESDNDIYGWAIPPKEDIFPHLRGEIFGFGQQKQRFEQYQQHHIEDKEERKQYDFQIFSIIKYFNLLLDNNPNIIDSLFVRQNYIIHCTRIAQAVRENRKIFLHKGAWFRFKGYACSQLHKIKTKTPEVGSKRYENVQKFGWDVKFAYHVIRLLAEIEQILMEGDLDLERNREQLKSIRRGEWTELQICNYFQTKERELEKLYVESKLQHSPDEEKIKELLLNCLEEHFGTLDKVIHIEGRYETALRQILEVCHRTIR